MTEDNYETPFLFVTTAQKSKEPTDKLFNKLLVYLRKSKLSLRGRFTQESLPSLTTKEQVDFPAVSFQEKQLEGIQKCTKEYCAVKLLTESEKNRMEGAKDKAALYKDFIIERLKAYIKEGNLVGYEERAENLETMKLAFPFLPFLSARYPKTTAFVQNRFFGKKTTGSDETFKYSMLRMEVMNMKNDKMQPVLRFSDAMEFEENKTKLIFEPQIYTNHFFDSSMRFFEVMSFPDPEYQSLIIMTDVMEVDELKKSGIIRALFKGSMVKGIEKYQSEEILRIHEAL